VNWIRRTAAVVLIAAGATLVLLPFPVSVVRETLIVRLATSDPPLSLEEARERYGGPIHPLDYQGLSDTPDARDKINSLGEEDASIWVDAGEWAALLRRVGEEGSPFLFSYRAKLFRVARVAPDGEGMLRLDVGFLALHWDPDHGYVVPVERDALDRYPAILAEMEAVSAAPEAPGPGVPLEEWDRFLEREADWSAGFVLEGRMVTGEVDPLPRERTVRVGWLRPLAVAAGVAALVLGVLLLVRVYRSRASRPGISVGSTWAALFCDAVTIVFALAMVLGVADALRGRLLGVPSFVATFAGALEPHELGALHFVATLGLILGVPVLTFYGTLLFGQRVEVDGSGVTSWGVFGRRFLAWEDLEAVSTREPRMAGAALTGKFRRLQKVLELEGRDCRITVNEPGNARKKEEILTALRVHAPDEQRRLLEESGPDW